VSSMRFVGREDRVSSASSWRSLMSTPAGQRVLASLSSETITGTHLSVLSMLLLFIYAYFSDAYYVCFLVCMQMYVVTSQKCVLLIHLLLFDFSLVYF